jgi:hypothetical protein
VLPFSSPTPHCADTLASLNRTANEHPTTRHVVRYRDILCAMFYILAMVTPRPTTRRFFRKRCRLAAEKVPVNNPMPADRRLINADANYLIQGCETHGVGSDCPNYRLWIRLADGTEIPQERWHELAARNSSGAAPALPAVFRGRCALAKDKTPFTSPVPNPNQRLAGRATTYLAQECEIHGPCCPSSRLWIRLADGTEIPQERWHELAKKAR